MVSECFLSKVNSMHRRLFDPFFFFVMVDVEFVHQQLFVWINFSCVGLSDVVLASVFCWERHGTCQSFVVILCVFFSGFGLSFIHISLCSFCSFIFFISMISIATIHLRDCPCCTCEF